MADQSLQLGLQQRLQQGLSPLQVQYVRMLEMSGPEVEEEVRRAVDENPALEVADEPAPADDPLPYYRLRASNYSPDDSMPEHQVAADGETLITSLLRQLGEINMGERQRIIAGYIAGDLDDNGYLTRGVGEMTDDMAFAGVIDAEPQEVRAALDTVRSLDPAGVGAVDLRDCLLLQLRRIPADRRTDAVAVAIEIIRDYFDLFAKMHLDRLRDEMGITDDQLAAAIDTIRALNPKPGASMVASHNNHVTPDFSVEVDDDDPDNPEGRITLTLLNNIPELQIAGSFDSPDDDSTPTPDLRRREAEPFIRQKRDEAASFMKMLRMRQETLYRVMSAIVRLQRPFFISEDPADLKPMILKDVAAITGDDLSVISRATAGKYVATRRGMYPLKYFFNERPKADDDTLSQHKILETLRSIVAAENPASPLSDEAITAMMKERGYDIARRTVAKYRERLGIPVARLRRNTLRRATAAPESDDNATTQS